VPRAQPDVDPDDSPAALGYAGPSRHEDDVGRIGVDLRGHAARGERLHDRVLHYPTQL